MKHKIKFDTLLDTKLLVEADTIAKEFNCEFKVEQVVGPGGGNPEVSFSGEALNVYNAYVKYYGRGDAFEDPCVYDYMHYVMDAEGNCNDNDGKLWFAELPLSLKKKWIAHYNDTFRHEELTIDAVMKTESANLDKAQSLLQNIDAHERQKARAVETDKALAKEKAEEL